MMNPPARMNIAPLKNIARLLSCKYRIVQESLHIHNITLRNMAVMKTDEDYQTHTRTVSFKLCSFYVISRESSQHQVGNLDVAC